MKLKRFGTCGMVRRTLSAFPSCIAMLTIWAKKKPASPLITSGDHDFWCNLVFALFKLDLFRCDHE